MKGLMAVAAVFAALLALVVVTGFIAAFTAPGGLAIGIVALALMAALAALVRFEGRREPAPPVLDTRRWSPGRGNLV